MNTSTTYRRRAFTLIELLVVVTIIAILIALLIPTVGYVKMLSKKTNTQAMLNSIATGLEQYYTDFQMYPPSQVVGSGYPVSPAFDRGSLMLAEGLVGYLDGNKDGAGSPPYANDPANGFRTRLGGTGKVYGPYVEPGGPSWKVIDTDHRVFVDYWGNEIIYYRAAPATINGQRRQITSVFAPLANPALPPDQNFQGLFVVGDNSNTVPLLPAPQTIFNPTQAPPAPPDPNTTLPQFFRLLGGGSNSSAPNTINPGDIILGRQSFLLISAGPDGTYFTKDDVVQGGK